MNQFIVVGVIDEVHPSDDESKPGKVIIATTETRGRGDTKTVKAIKIPLKFFGAAERFTLGAEAVVSGRVSAWQGDKGWYLDLLVLNVVAFGVEQKPKPNSKPKPQAASAPEDDAPF